MKESYHHRMDFAVLNNDTSNGDSAIDRIKIMLEQEDGPYSYERCFPSTLTNLESFGEERLNWKWREKICQWTYNVVDHFDLSREVVGISLNLFDRYLATRGNRCSGNLALLTSLTTLYIAIKLEDSTRVPLSVLSDLSRGQFGRKDIDRMEWSVLSELGWKVHPPTVYSFISDFLHLLPCEIHPSVKKGIEDMARYICELAVYDSFFVGMKNSVIALAAILNVWDDTDTTKIPMSVRDNFLHEINNQFEISCFSESIICSRHRLRRMFIANVDATSNHSSPRESNNLKHHYDVVDCGTGKSVRMIYPAKNSEKSASSIGSEVSSYGNNSTSNSSNRPPLGNTSNKGRSRSNSFESKGSYPNPRRRCVAISPMACSTFQQVHTTSCSPLGSAH